MCLALDKGAFSMVVIKRCVEEGEWCGGGKIHRSVVFVARPWITLLKHLISYAYRSNLIDRSTKYNIGHHWSI